jgi:uncharacterized protein (TIGR02271 family)
MINQPEHANLPSNQTQNETAAAAVIPVIQEQVLVEKQVVEKGKVRISKQVREYEELVDVPLLGDEVVVERVAVNQYVESAPAVRYEGETMIIPVVREVAVVEKRLVLAEELRVTKRRVETHAPQVVTLRKEEVSVERAASDNATVTGNNQQSG